MPQIVGVRLTAAGRVHYFDPNGLKLQVGDRVTVEDDHGEARGEVAISADQVLFSDLRGPMLRVLSTLGGSASLD